MDDSDSDEQDELDGGESHRYMWALTLSLQLDATDNIEDEETGKMEATTPHKVKLKAAGAILPEKSIKVVSLVPGKQKEDGFVPGFAIVNIKSKLLIDEAEKTSMLPHVECKLPFDQLQDEYEPSDRDSAASLDALAKKLLKPGKSLK